MYVEELLVNQDLSIIERQREVLSVNLNQSYHTSISVTKTELSRDFISVIKKEFGSLSRLYTELNKASSEGKNWIVLCFDTRSLNLSVKTVNSEFEIDENEFVLMSLFNDKSDQDHQIYHFIDWDEVEKNYRIASYL